MTSTLKRLKQAADLFEVVVRRLRETALQTAA